MNIRTATLDDLKAVAAVEAACFPAAEAASEERLRDRISYFGRHFWLLFGDDGTLISFVDGMVTDQRDLTDDLYGDASLHDEKGAWQMIFGVNTLPSYRKRGYAALLLTKAIDDARKEGRQGLVRISSCIIMLNSALKTKDSAPRNTVEPFGIKCALLFNEG